MVIMLVNYYLFVFQYFNYNSILCFQMISSANIQLFHSSPSSKNNSPSPCAICFAFFDETTGCTGSFSNVSPREPGCKMYPFLCHSILLCFHLLCKYTHFQIILQDFLYNFATKIIQHRLCHKTHKTFKTIIFALAATQPCRRRKAAGWQAFFDQEKRFCRVLQVL